MTEPPGTLLRPLLAALLICVLTLSGAARGLAGTPAQAHGPGEISGVAPICHSGPSEGQAPADGAAPACCDACALMVCAVLPAPPALARPVVFAQAPFVAVPGAGASTQVRVRTPRLSQGPPDPR